MSDHIEHECPNCGSLTCNGRACYRKLVDDFHEKDAELASVETSYLEVCRILGAIYAADGRCDEPAPYEEVQKMARATMHTADRVYEAEGAMMDLTAPRPRDEWHEEDGAALWWKFPVVEPPYCGTPLDEDFPDYVTHWSPLPNVVEPS